MQLIPFIGKKIDSLLQQVDTPIKILFLCDEDNTLSIFFEQYNPTSKITKLTFIEKGFLDLHRTLYQEVIKSDLSSTDTKYVIHLPYFTKDMLNQSIFYQFTVLQNTKTLSLDVLYYIQEYAESIKNIGRDKLDDFLKTLNTKNVSLDKLDNELENLQTQSESPYWNALISSHSILHDLIEGKHMPSSETDKEVWYTFIYNRYLLSKKESIHIQKCAPISIGLIESLFFWILKVELALTYPSLKQNVLGDLFLTKYTEDMILKSAKLLRSEKKLHKLRLAFESAHVASFQNILNNNEATTYLYHRQKMLFLASWISAIHESSSTQITKLENALGKMGTGVFTEYDLHIKTLLLCSQWQRILTRKKEDSEFGELKNLVNFYIQNSRIDNFQRHTSQYVHTLSLHTDHDDELVKAIQKLVEHLQDLHWNWTQYLYSKTIDIYTKYDEVLPFIKDLQQRQVFYNFVENNSQNIAFAYIWLDAFRYEMIHDLQSGLQAIFRDIELSIHPTMSELPSNTEVGMNLMGPMINDSDMLLPMLSKQSAKKNPNNITGFKSPSLNKSINSREGRKDSLNKGALQYDSGSRKEGHPLKGTNEILSGTKNTPLFSNKDFLAIHFGDIDALGDKLSSETHQFNNAIGKLIETIVHLIYKGVKRFVLTSDHGYLLRHKLTSIDIPISDQLYRRHFISKSIVENDDLFHVSFAKLQYSIQFVGTQYIHFPKSLSVFSNSDSEKRNEYHFIHGGPSLQERLVPTITFEAPTIKKDALFWKSIEINAERISTMKIQLKGMIEVPLDQNFRDFSALIRVREIIDGKRASMVPCIMKSNNECLISGVVLYSPTTNHMYNINIDILLESEYSQLEVEFINPHLSYDHTTQKHRSHKITV